MKRLWLFFLAMGTLAITSCEKEVDLPATPDNESVTLKIKPNFDGGAFVLNQEYINESNYRISFSDLRFYLGNISLIREGGGSVPLSEIEFYSITDDASDAMAKTFHVDNGAYTGIKYSWGVPVELGGTDNPDFDETSFPVGHPLNLDNGMYWAWNSGYRFSEVEGRYNIDANSTGPLESTFAYHPGTQELYRTLNVEIPFTLDGKGATTINIDLDLSKIWYSDTDVLDVADPLQNDLAGGNVMTLGIRYVDLLMGSISHSLDN